MRKIYLLILVLFTSVASVTAQCTLTNASGCVCNGGGTNCDLLPDVKAAKPPLTLYGNSQGVIEYSQSGNGSNDGRLRISVATPNIGHGPLHVVADSAYVCGTDTLFANPIPATCPDGITAAKVLVKQRIYHKNGNIMTYYNRPAGSMTYHPSHGHMHVDNWGIYTLRTATSDPNPLNWPIVGNGAKLAFCLMDFGSCAAYNGHCEDDNGNILTNTPNVGLGGGNFSCSSTSQGITAGYEDIYYQHLDGMWIVIPPGTCNGNYYIVCQQDPYNVFMEENDNNNVTAVPVTLTKQGGVVPTITASGSTTFCSGGSVTLTSSTASDYLWSNGATTQSITVSASGTYSCTVNNTSSCATTSAPVTVTVATMPVTVNASSTSICAGASVNLTSSATGTGTTTQNVNFSNNTAISIPDNNTTGAVSSVTVSGINPSTLSSTTVVSATVNITHPYDGDIELRLYAPNGAYQLLSNRRGGSGDNYTNTVFTMGASNLITSGAAPFTGNYTPEGNFANFTGNVNGTWSLRVYDRASNDVGTINNWTLTLKNTVSTTINYAWTSNPAGFNASTANTSATPAQTTTYTITATESGTGCVGSNNVTVNVSNPAVQFSGNTSICAGASTTLTASGATSYVWSPSTGLNTTTSGTVTANPSSTQTYSVVGTTNGCTDTKTITVNVTTLPVVTTSGSVAICEHDAVTLTAGGATTYVWSPATGLNTTTGSSVIANPTSTQTYNVTGSLNGCNNTAQVTVTVNPLPNVSVSPSGTISSCSPVVLNASTSASNIQWKFNGANISGATTSSYTASASGNYSVYVVDVNGCNNESPLAQLTIGGGTPSIAAPNGTSFCAGTAGVILSTQSSGSYQWYRNGVLLSGANAASYTANSNGNYHCYITNTGCSGASNTLVVTQINNPTPVISNSTPLSFCSSGSVVLTSNSFAGVAYQWQKNSIDIAGATNQTFSANTSGTYRVRQTANGCSKLAPGVVVSSAATSLSASIAANGATTFCNGGSVVLSVVNAIPGYNFQWQNNGVNISGASTNFYTATATGNYTCVVSASCGSIPSNSIAVSVGAINAVVSPAGTVTICSGSSVALSANTGAGYQYQWQLNGADINGATAATFNANASGNYTVAIISACGNATSPATTVNLSALAATLSPAGTTTICAGTATTYSANTGTNITYQWYRNGAALAGATNSIYATSSYGSYYVVLTQGGVCTATSNIAALAVTNNPNATITPAGPVTFCAGQTATLTANNFAGVIYQWQKNGINISGAVNQSLLVSSAGSYRVKQTANNCSKFSSAVGVTVNCRMGADGEMVSVEDRFGFEVMPNPFTNTTKITLSNTADLKTTTINVINTIGNVVKQISNVGNTEVVFERDQLAAGIYMIIVKDAFNQPVVKRIVIE